MNLFLSCESKKIPFTLINIRIQEREIPNEKTVKELVFNAFPNLDRMISS